MIYKNFFYFHNFFKKWTTYFQKTLHFEIVS